LLAAHVQQRSGKASRAAVILKSSPHGRARTPVPLRRQSLSQRKRNEVMRGPLAWRQAARQRCPACFRGNDFKDATGQEISSVFECYKRY